MTAEPERADPSLLIPTEWSREAENAAYEALAGVPWSEWGQARPFLHGGEFEDYGPGLSLLESR